MASGGGVLGGLTAQHAVAVARWRRAQGQLLSHYQIVVENKRRSTPWFAKF